MRSDHEKLVPGIRAGALFKNRTHRAGGCTGSEINTLSRVNIKLFRVGKGRFSWRGMDAIHRTHIYARSVFHPNAGKRDHVGHRTLHPPEWFSSRFGSGAFLNAFPSVAVLSAPGGAPARGVRATGR